MKLTEAQHRAIYTHDRNLIVVAGAGSGKTRVLVERYLALLDLNLDWPLNSLVAITFTKKAAGEMRDRVRKSLEERLHAAGDEVASRRWSDLLASMDSARIDTIHGLCATLLRANAAEAGVDPDFAVLDETDAAILLDEAIDVALRDLIAAGDPAATLFTHYDSWSIREVLSDFALLNADIPDLPDDLLGRWQAAWESDAPAHINAFLGQVASIGTVVSPPAEDAIGQRWSECLDCIDYLYRADDVDSALNALERIASIRMQGGSAKHWGGQDEFIDAKDRLTAIRDAAKWSKKTIGDPPGELDGQAAQLLPLWVSLIRRVKQSYQDAKAAASSLDFDDLEQLTRMLLTSFHDIRARYRGSEFHHLLVDEFQDTNAAQWDIIQSLAALDSPGSMFVVGDEKQSIYAFRGADVSVFGAVRERIRAANGESIPLVQSYRTHAPLIDSFNVLFGRLLIRDATSPVSAFQVERGDPMTASREKPPGDGPHIDLLLIPPTEDEHGEKLPAEDRRRWEALEIVRHIQNMVASEQPVYDRDTGTIRPMRYDDAAILFQSLSNVTLYEEVFKAVGLPFVTVAGRGYYNRQEIWDVLNLLNALYNPADNLSLASALRSPMFGLSDDALLALRIVGGLLWDALNITNEWLPSDEVEKVRFARDCLYRLRATAGRITISELLRDALAQTGYLAIVSGLPDGARRRGNIEKLLDKAQQAGQVTLGSFSRYLRDLSDREVREGEATLEVTGAVTIMSVHASKGLEYPLIVIADASWKRPAGGRDLLIVDRNIGLACKVYDAAKDEFAPSYAYRRANQLRQEREDAERLRLLYVAATRAQDYLVISGQIKDDKATEGWTAEGWLGKLCDAVDDLDAVNGVRVTIAQPATVADFQADERGESAWESDAVSTGKLFPANALMPPLLSTITVQREAHIRHLSATHIADLGGAESAQEPDSRAFYRSRFRRKVMYDAPARVDPINRANSLTVSARQVGEIVHEALRYWQIPGDSGDDDQLMRVLRSYAWRHGIIEEALLQNAVKRAYDLLQRFKSGDIFGWINEASQVYRELPFIYERDGRIIHGVIDVLFHRKDGTWVIADYKTSYVKAKDGSLDAITAHARRYHLQLGIYAESVKTQLAGIVPLTYIHYIRHTQTIHIPEVEWRAALNETLSDRIVKLLTD